jgi:hypothetical protein
MGSAMDADARDNRWRRGNGIFLRWIVKGELKNNYYLYSLSLGVIIDL